MPTTTTKLPAKTFKGRTGFDLRAFAAKAGALSSLTPEFLRDYWEARGTANLKGKTVKEVVYLPMDEEPRSRCTPVIIFTDGDYLVLKMDDEGNGPGSADLQGQAGRDKEPFIIDCIPTV